MDRLKLQGEAPEKMSALEKERAGHSGHRT